MVDVTLVDASDDIEGKRGNPTRPPLKGGDRICTKGRCTMYKGSVIIYDEFDGTGGTFEGKRMLAEPNMVGFESVTGDSNGTESGGKEFVELLFREGESVGDHAPRVATLMQGLTYLSEIFAHQGFTTGDNDEYLVGIDVGRDLGIYDAQEILRGHVGCLHRGNTVAATMETMDITTEGGFPEQLLQRMELLEVISPQTLQPQR